MDDATIQPIDSLEPGVAAELGYLGRYPATTCLADNRFAYQAYIPRQYYNIRELSLAVLVHGSDRNFNALRDGFAAFAEEHSCALLTPLFPVAPGDPQDASGYKFINYRGVRYDQILLAMVDEIKARFPRIETGRFFLYGFSGGGQFVHRFAYLHAPRLRGLICGAPGSQTHLDYTRTFPDGVQDLETQFDQPLDLAALKQVPTMFICGDADTDIKYLIARRRTTDASARQGRHNALLRLEASWKKAGANSHVFTVEGAKHEEHKMWNPAIDFLRRLLNTSTPSAISSTNLTSGTPLNLANSAMKEPQIAIHV